MKQMLYWGLLFLFSGCISTNPDILPYHLFSVTQNSDINYEMISQMDSLPPGRVKLKNEFYPVEGEYTVLRFLSFSYGDGVFSSFETNNLLILKVDSCKQIVDGFFYPLQWAEAPLSSKLCRITAQNVKLKNKLNIRRLLKKQKGTENERGYLVFSKDIELLKCSFIERKDKDLCPYEKNEFEISYE